LIESKYTIVKRKLVLDVNQSGRYGESVALDNGNYAIHSGSIAKGTDQLNLDFDTTATNKSNVGMYNISMSYNNANYDISLNNAAFTILPRIMKIRIGNYQTTYGDLINIDQSNYTLQTGSVVNNDKLDLNILSRANNTSNVGVYEIYAIYDNDNYDITFIKGQHTILQRKVSIKLLDQSTTRGVTYSIDQDAYEVTDGSIVNPEDFDLEIYSDARMFSPVGNYTLKAKTDNTNYDIIVENANLYLKISVLDIGFIAISVIIIIVIIIKVVKHLQKKKKNKDLFDKWIKW